MKETPIIFSTEMVKAILDGRKTKTRRIIKPAPHPEESLIQPYNYTQVVIDKDGIMQLGDKVFGTCTDDGEICWKCPYGQAGDLLWVRETFRLIPTNLKEPYHVQYKTDASEWELINCVWKPSIHMFKKYARIWLEITDVRVERLQEIKEEDCLAEGVDVNKPWGFPDGYVNAFSWLWDSLNAKRGYGWEVNPWVWVIDFKLNPSTRLRTSNIMERSCYRCGKTERLHKDRIKPGIEGGDYNSENVRDACRDCHQYRHKRDNIIMAIERELIDLNNSNQAERLRILRKRLEVCERENTPELIRKRGYFPYFNVYNERLPIRKLTPILHYE